MTTNDLQKTFEDAEANAQKIQTDRDTALQNVRAEYDANLRAANTEAAQAQKAWLNAQAADALKDRPDGRAVAEALGLTLPE